MTDLHKVRKLVSPEVVDARSVMINSRVGEDPEKYVVISFTSLELARQVRLDSHNGLLSGNRTWQWEWHD